MTTAEKRARLDQNQTAKIIWVVLIVLQAIGALLVVIALLALTVLAGVLGGAHGGILAGIAVTVAILGLGLTALIFIGLLRLEKWVVWLMWVNVALSLPAIFSSSRSFFQSLLPILVAVGYTYVLRQVYPKTPAAPMPTPTTPTV